MTCEQKHHALRQQFGAAVDAAVLLLPQQLTGQVVRRFALALEQQRLEERRHSQNAELCTLRKLRRRPGSSDKGSQVVGPGHELLFRCRVHSEQRRNDPRRHRPRHRAHEVEFPCAADDVEAVSHDFVDAWRQRRQCGAKAGLNHCTKATVIGSIQEEQRPRKQPLKAA
ncbi:MAG TPA: hypothetical protein VLK85_28740 [Ramlibacter sp.]|nr:hypothetical protein [Ramlibacter sp.]